MLGAKNTKRKPRNSQGLETPEMRSVHQGEPSCVESSTELGMQVDRVDTHPLCDVVEKWILILSIRVNQNLPIPNMRRRPNIDRE